MIQHFRVIENNKNIIIFIRYYHLDRERGFYYNETEVMNMSTNARYSEYEPVAHGSAAFPIELYSERVYDVKPHHHKEYELFRLTEGRMLFGIGGEEHIIEAGTTVFIEPNVTHYALDTTENSERHFNALLFGAEALGNKNDPCRKLLESVRIDRFPKIPDRFFEDCERVFQMRRSSEFGCEIEIKAFLFDLLSFLFRSRQYTAVSSIRGRSGLLSEELPSDAAVSAVIRYIESRYAEPINLDTLLPLISYSKSHFMRLFKEKTGYGLTSFVNRYRVEKSCLELLYSDKPISLIAGECGFGSVQYYTKLFGRYIGVSPARYRADAGALGRRG